MSQRHRTGSVIVLGGGLSGIAAAYTLALAGIDDITVIERGEALGGLAGSFERDGHVFPLGYHHILHLDRPLLYFLDTIGALSDVRWRRIRMLFHLNERHHDLSSVPGFLGFPMAWSDKLRFVRLMARAFVRRDWSDWVGCSGAELVDRWGGPGVRAAVFDPLTQLKFECSSADVSAAWLGMRLHYREGSAPLGYIPGRNWTSVLCEGLTRLLADRGIRVRLRTTVARLDTSGASVCAAVLENGERLTADTFVSTVPTEVYRHWVSHDDTPHLQPIRYTALISMVCATRQQIVPDFYWMNIASPGFTARGLFTLSSLNPGIGGAGETCLNFVTHLNGRDRSLFTAPDEELIARYRDDFRRLFGFALEPSWVHITRVPMYSPIFDVQYRNPPVRSATWENLYFAGNYRTFPSVASTGTALRSGIEAGDTILQDAGLRTDLPLQLDRFTIGHMRRADKR